jgi:hypothetical protein
MSITLNCLAVAARRERRAAHQKYLYRKAGQGVRKHTMVELMIPGNTHAPALPPPGEPSGNAPRTVPFQNLVNSCIAQTTSERWYRKVAFINVAMMKEWVLQSTSVTSAGTETDGGADTAGSLSSSTAA